MTASRRSCRTHKRFDVFTGAVGAVPEALHTPKASTNWRRHHTGDNKIRYKISLQTLH